MTDVETRLAALEASVAALLKRTHEDDADREEAAKGMAKARATMEAVDEACRLAGLD